MDLKYEQKQISFCLSYWHQVVFIGNVKSDLDFATEKCGCCQDYT